MRLRPFGTGLALELARVPFHARLVLGRGGGPGSAIGELELYGPADVPVRPSPEQKRSWSAEKRRYIGRADAICVRTLGSLIKASDFAPSVSTASRQLDSLRPRAAETRLVQSFLRPLRNLARAARAATIANGENALPAAVAIGEYAMRFDKAAARYGLSHCTVR